MNIGAKDRLALIMSLLKGDEVENEKWSKCPKAAHVEKFAADDAEAEDIMVDIRVVVGQRAQGKAARAALASVRPAVDKDVAESLGVVTKVSPALMPSVHQGPPGEHRKGPLGAIVPVTK